MEAPQSILDCPCKGDGFIFTKAGDIPCPMHFHCGKDEEYRLNLLRLEYQNMRGFLCEQSGLKASEVDSMIRLSSDPSDPTDWVRGAQTMVKRYLRTLPLAPSS